MNPPPREIEPPRANPPPPPILAPPPPLEPPPRWAHASAGITESKTSIRRKFIFPSLPGSILLPVTWSQSPTGRRLPAGPRRPTDRTFQEPAHPSDVGTPSTGP